MHRIMSAGVTLCAAAALATPVAAGAATAPNAASVPKVTSIPNATSTSGTIGKPRPAPGFTPVSLPISPYDIASTTDGVVYVSGLTKDGKPTVIRVIRINSVLKVIQTVSLPGLDDVPSLHAAKGHVYAYGTTGAARTNYLYDIVGLRSTRLSVPSETAEGAPVFLNEVTTDEQGGLWLSMGMNNPMGRYFRGDGHTWQELRPNVYLPAAVHIYATQGHLYMTTYGGGIGTVAHSYEWDGASWQVGPTIGMSFMGTTWYERLWTVTAPGNYTRWGFGYSAGEPPRNPPMPMHGACTHVGPGPSCVGPDWAVSAVARLADGSVVLGGDDERYPTQGSGVNGGFAVVPRPGATPVTIPGDNGDSVRTLAAPMKGHTVWAITEQGDWPADTTLQVYAPGCTHGHH